MTVTDNSVLTIADIALLAGVSKSTVSRALRDSPLISEQTRGRIQTIARKHNFKIHQPARSLSLKQSHTIAFITYGGHKAEYFASDPFQLEILGAISSTLTAHNYDLLMAHVDLGDADWPSRYSDAGRVDGFILLSCTRVVRKSSGA